MARGIRYRWTWFVALITMGATGAPLATSAGHQGDGAVCENHPPILIRGDFGPLGFVLASPTLAPPVYRPGSGVTSGSGTSSDPFVIENLCIDVTSYPLGFGISIQDTTAAFVIHNVHIDATTASQEPTSAGIRLSNVRDAQLRTNYVDGPSVAGIVVLDSSNVMVLENVMSAATGIHVTNSSSLIVDGNRLGPGENGILAVGATDIVWSRNTFSAISGTGIRISASTQNTIWANELSAISSSTIPNAAGIRIEGGAQNTVQENAVTAYASTGIHVEGSSDNLLVENLLRGNYRGIALVDAHNNDIRENLLQQNGPLPSWDGAGIVLDRSVGNMIQTNKFSENGRGALFMGGSANTLRNNVFEADDHGVVFRWTMGDVLENNTIRGAGIGVESTGSQDLRIAANVLTGGGIRLSGPSPSDFRHDILPDNTVNGGLFVYLHNVSGVRVDAPPSQVMIASSKDVVVTNGTFQGTRTGVQLAFATNVTIQDSDFHNHSFAPIEVFESWDTRVSNIRARDNGEGLRIWRGGRNVVQSSTFEAQLRGVLMVDSAANTVADNLFLDVHLSVQLMTSDQNTIRGNRISMGTSPISIGILLWRSDANVVHHNTIREKYRAIELQGASLNEVRENVFSDNAGTAIRVDSSPDNLFRYNNIEGNANGLFESFSGPVDARWNWWGCAGGPSDWFNCNRALGSVVTDPWLVGPYAEAGA